MSLPIQNQAADPARDLQPLFGDLSLRRGRVHELCGPSRIQLAARIMARTGGPVVWIRPGWLPERLNAAGLQPLADPARLILVQADRDEGLLWAAEEALRSGAAPLVVAELLSPPALTPTRRLHLAAEAGSTAAGRDGHPAPLGLILLPGQGGAQGVESRWHLAPAPSRALLWSEEDSFTLTRLRARLLPPASWSLRLGHREAVLEPRPLVET
ncbi:MAG: ImuA family protein [Tabrizicola sp.]